MKRKLIETGSSLAVTLPAEVVRDLGLKKGQEVDVSVHPISRAVIIRPGVQLWEDGKVTRRAREEIARLLKRRAKLYEKLAR